MLQKYFARLPEKSSPCVKTPQSFVENNQRNPLCFNALEVAFIHTATQDTMPSQTAATTQGSTAALLSRPASVQPPQTTWVEAEAKAGAPRLLNWPSGLCHR